jgi:CxxC-x17-CxxC domain-containing protein
MAAMAYNRDRGNRPGGGNRNFGRPRFTNDRQEMYSATCANCGKQCEVPFRPTGNKPVLCRECFQNNRGSDLRRPERSSFDRPRFNNEDRSRTNDYTAQFESLNAKMDKILDLLQSPTDPAPLESNLNEKVLEEIAEEIQEEKEVTEKKPKNKKVISSKKK